MLAPLALTVCIATWIGPLPAVEEPPLRTDSDPAGRSLGRNGQGVQSLAGLRRSRQVHDRPDHRRQTAGREQADGPRLRQAEQGRSTPAKFSSSATARNWRPRSFPAKCSCDPRNPRRSRHVRRRPARPDPARRTDRTGRLALFSTPISSSTSSSSTTLSNPSSNKPAPSASTAMRPSTARRSEIVRAVAKQGGGHPDLRR